MLASEFIRRLQTLMDEHGDHRVVYGDNDEQYPELAYYEDEDQQVYVIFESIL
jgi:hypothetical protein